MRLLAPDDAADVLQAMEPGDRPPFLALLDPATRGEVTALLAYAEDAAGGLMNPRYVRLRPEITVEVAIRYLRRQAIRGHRSDRLRVRARARQRLLGVVSFRELFAAPPERLVSDIMHTDLVTVTDETDQEAVAQLLAEEGLLAIPVVDAEGRMKGIVTADDIVDVVQEEATEDIQKIGGSEALDAPYLQIGFADMVRKRGRWLAVLFVGEMLTATAMGYFEEEIARAVVLALFVPLIISSGGNSGSQATTLVIRAMALGEVRLRDWWRVVRRELAHRPRARPAARPDRPGAHPGVAGGVRGLRRALPARGPDRGGEPAGRGDVGHARRLDAAVRAAAARRRPGERLGAVRGDAGGRDRAGHLLHGGAVAAGGTLL